MILAKHLKSLWIRYTCLRLSATSGTHHERFVNAFLTIIRSNLRLIVNFIAKLPARIIVNLITIIRPLFGPSGFCKYRPSCTQYAKQTLQTERLYRACWLILKRVLSCW